jgi:uncharacterized protein (TIGR02001 family)
MKLIRGGAFLVGVLGVASATQAGVTSTWTLVSDYDFRGITQSAQDPALQASVDYAHDSGWYLGLWGSNIDFGPGDPNAEVDIYTGFTKTLDSGFNYDLGGVYYAYPSASDFSYFELYAGVGFTAESGLSVKGKFFFSPDFGGDTTDGDTEAQYISGDLTVPLPANFSILGHAGYSFGDYWDALEDAAPPTGRPYFDYSIGVGYSVNQFSLALKFIDGSDIEELDGAPGDVFTSESRVVFSVATTFPWGE